MSERYRRLFSTQNNLGVAEAPVIIKAGALLHDTISKKLIGQLKFQNLTEKTVSSIKVIITCFDTASRQLGNPVTFEYLDLSANFASEFGSKTPIYLPNVATRSFNVAISEIVFYDGSIWSSDNDAWESLSENSTTIRRFNASVEYKQVAPLIKSSSIEELTATLATLKSIAPYKDVTDEIALCEKNLEAAKKDEAERLAEEEIRLKKARKAAAIGLPILVGLILCLILTFSVIVPAIQYNQALDLIEQGKDEEAYKILETLSGGDSAAQIEELQSRALVRAEKMYQEGNLSKAVELLNAVNCHNDKTYAYRKILSGDYKSAIKDYGYTEIIIPNNVTCINASAFENCSELIKVTIPSSVTEIGSYAFRHCPNLTSISIPDAVTKIGFYAFSGCTGLTSISIPDAVTEIDSNAFYGCTGLTSIIIPDSVTTISSGAFHNCTGLTSISIPDTVTEIEPHVFNGCTGLTSISIPNAVTSIGSHAFDGCKALTSISIPDAVTSIGSHAFNGCIALTSITIPDSVTTIDSYAFSGCSNLTIFCEASSRPSGWSNWYGSWNSYGCPVIWGFTGESYTYKFETNGGTDIDDITSNTAITLSSPEKTGFVFVGWYDNSALEGSALDSTYYSSTNHTLYAKWITEEEYRDGTSFEKAIIISVDETKNDNLSTSSEKVYFKFTPTETDTYRLKIKDSAPRYSYYGSSDNLYVKLYHGDEYLTSTTDYDITISYDFTEGETYYITVEPSSYSATGDFSISISNNSSDESYYASESYYESSWW